MPSSTHFLLHNITGEIIKSEPVSVLDIGIGYGKYGFLIRDFIEVHQDRVYPEQWKIRVDGVEIWKEYVERLPWLKQFYNNIYVGDINDLIDGLPEYDLIIAGDVIEHLPKDSGQEVIKKCIRLAKRKFILSIPVGDWTGNRIVADNPFEAHRSVWWAKDLIRIGKEELGIAIKTYAHKGIRGGYCVAIYDKAKRGDHE